jgi:hypothetical protein
LNGYASFVICTLNTTLYCGGCDWNARRHWTASCPYNELDRCSFIFFEESSSFRYYVIHIVNLSPWLFIINYISSVHFPSYSVILFMHRSCFVTIKDHAIYTRPHWNQCALRRHIQCKTWGILIKYYNMLYRNGTLWKYLISNCIKDYISTNADGNKGEQWNCWPETIISD